MYFLLTLMTFNYFAISPICVDRWSMILQAIYEIWTMNYALVGFETKTAIQQDYSSTYVNSSASVSFSTSVSWGFMALYITRNNWLID